MSEKRKRTALDLDVKFEIISEIENGRKQSVVWKRKSTARLQFSMPCRCYGPHGTQ